MNLLFFVRMLYLTQADKGKPGETRGRKTDRPKLSTTKRPDRYPLREAGHTNSRMKSQGAIWWLGCRSAVRGIPHLYRLFF